jgi:hypothetical protein
VRLKTGEKKICQAKRERKVHAPAVKLVIVRASQALVESRRLFRLPCRSDDETSVCCRIASFLAMTGQSHECLHHGDRAFAIAFLPYWSRRRKDNRRLVWRSQMWRDRTQGDRRGLQRQNWLFT